MSDQHPDVTMWDARYGGDDYVYGTRPNDFLAEEAGRLPPGARVLCLAEGEGRNAVHLAGLGHRVTGVDASRVGLDKARRLAAGRGVEIEAVVSDLGEYAIAPAAWDAVVLIFCHLLPELRRKVHRDVAAGLRPGGLVLLEAYTPDQLRYRTGGPSMVEALQTAESLREDFAGLEFLVLRERVREVREGVFHTGEAAVVQLVARKPG